jgi:hypothetical protein
MAATARQQVPVDVTVGVDHATVQAALAMALPALVLLAAVRPRGSAALAAGAAVCAAYLGVVSLAEPGTAAGLPPVWSAAAVVWGAAVLAAVVTVALLPVRAVVPARE